MTNDLDILDTVMSVIAFDRLNLQFKKEPNYKYWRMAPYSFSKKELILNHYQLPINFFDWRNYDQIIESDNIVFDEIKSFVKLLKQRKKAYLSIETKKDLKLIRNAIRLQWGFEELSKKLSLDLSKQNAPYYWFIYYEILREGRTTAQDFLEDIRHAEKINLMANIALYKTFVANIGKLWSDKSETNVRLRDNHKKLNFLYDFIENKKFTKYKKIIKLNEIL
jgi:hypothetical protein